MINAFYRMLKDKSGLVPPAIDSRTAKKYFDFLIDKTEEELAERMYDMKIENITRLRNALGTREFIDQLKGESREQHAKIMDMLKAAAREKTNEDTPFRRGRPVESAQQEAAEAETRAARAEERAAREEERAADEELKATKVQWWKYAGIGTKGGSEREKDAAKREWEGAKRAGGIAAMPMAAAGKAVYETGMPGFFLFLSIVLYFSDIWFNFNGINIDAFLGRFARVGDLQNLVSVLLNGAVLTILIAYYILNRPKDKAQFFSFAALVWLGSLIFFLGGFGFGFLHIIFAIFLYFMGIPADADKTKMNFTMALFLFIDFFGYGILAKALGNPIISNRLVVPIWFYFTLFLTREYKKNWFTKTLIILVVSINVFYFASGITAVQDLAEGLSTEQLQEGKEFFSTAFANMKNFTITFVDGLFNPQKYYDREALTGEYGEKEAAFGINIAFTDATRSKGIRGEDISVSADIVKQAGFREEIKLDGSCKAMRDKEEIPGELSLSKKVMERMAEDKEDRAVARCTFKKEATSNMREGKYDVVFDVVFTSRYDKEWDVTYVRSVSDRHVKSVEKPAARLSPIQIEVISPAENSVVEVKEKAKEDIETADAILSFNAKLLPAVKIKKIASMKMTLPNGLSPKNCDYDVKKDENQGNSYSLEQGALNLIEKTKELKMICDLKADDLKRLIGVVLPIMPRKHKISADYDLEIEKKWALTIIDPRTKLKDCNVVCEDDKGCLCPKGCQKKEAIKGQGCTEPAVEKDNGGVPEPAVEKGATQ